MTEEFTWIDGERLIRFGDGALAAAPELLEQRGFDGYALLTTPRWHDVAAAERAAIVVDVPTGPVPDASRAVIDEVGERPIAALGGGRVIDTAKAIAGVRGSRCAAIPTTLSGAELTPFHRLPAGLEGRLVRPSLVVADPGLMTSQPAGQRAASAMNALAHAVEALYSPLRNPVATMAALRSAGLFAGAVPAGDERRSDLALAATLAGYASGLTGFAVHHVVCQTIVRLAGTPHAQTNAVMLPHSVRFMAPRAPDEIAALANALGTGDPAEAIASLTALSDARDLVSIGFDAERVDEVVEQALGQPMLQNTPRPPDGRELRSLITAALESRQADRRSVG